MQFLNRVKDDLAHVFDASTLPPPDAETSKRMDAALADLDKQETAEREASPRSLPCVSDEPPHAAAQ